jgi:DNA processing protein
MTELEALVGLNMTLDIGSARLTRLLDYFHKPENIMKAHPDKLKSVAGIGSEIAGKIASIKKEDLNKEFALSKKYGLKILTQNDKDYPQSLKEIPGSPIVLYVKGEFRSRDNLSLAVVGSRRASFYGLEMAEKFSSQLAAYGFTVVSGMARGIDTHAHRGALKQKGRTIAVMGSGFGRIYPEENKELLEEISKSGAVISEFPIDTRPFKQNFPRRNRIISGLSKGVLVVEAAKNSGALITADFALEQGKEVFALPGKVDSGNSFGTNMLIKQGAKIVCTIEDILEELGLGIAVNERLPDESIPDIEEVKGLTPRELLLYRLLSRGPVFLDEIAEESGMDITEIFSLLLKLQMKKLIKQLPGNQFRRNQDE